MKHTKYPELKIRLKQLAKEIREWKDNRKQDRRSKLNMKQWEVQSKIYHRAYEFRHKHIAYCMLRGRKYEEIELSCNNLPDFDEVDKIRGQYEQKTLCVST